MVGRVQTNSLAYTNLLSSEPWELGEICPSEQGFFPPQEKQRDLRRQCRPPEQAGWHSPLPQSLGWWNSCHMHNNIKYIRFSKKLGSFSAPTQERKLLFSHPVMSGSLRPMDYSPPGLPVSHPLPEFTQAHAIELQRKMSLWVEYCPRVC